MELKIINSEIERIHKSNLGVNRFFSDPPELIVAIGISGCGKSSNAPPNYCVHNKDSVRFMLLNTDKTLNDFEKDLEPIVEKLHYLMFNVLVKNRLNIYLDSTNLKRFKREKYVSLSHTHGYKILYFVFTNFRQARENNLRRKRIVPEKELNRMVDEFEYPSIEEISKYSIEIREFKESDNIG